MSQPRGDGFACDAKQAALRTVDATMSTFLLLAGAHCGPDQWHLVAPLLEAAAHDVVVGPRA